jgi:hypothetical protein
VIVRPLAERLQEADAVFGPMARAIDELFATYSDEQLALILYFANRANGIFVQQIARLRSERRA